MIPHPIDLYIGLKRFFTNEAPPCDIEIKRPNGFKVFEIPIIKNAEDMYLYILLKKNIDTFNAVNVIKRKYGGTWRWAGLKDASAITLQYLSSDVKIEALDIHISPSKCLSLRRIGKGYVDVGMVKSNVFLIELNANCYITDYVISIIRKLRYLPGIYSYQRFGTRRPNTHIVGKLILREEYEEAINVILGEPSPWESSVARKLREVYYLEGPKVYLNAPKYLDLERRVASALLRGYPPKKVLRSLPQFKLFLNAFQAYIYNKALTTYEDTSPFRITPGFKSWHLYEEFFKEEEIKREQLSKYRLKGTFREPYADYDVSVIDYEGSKVYLVLTLPKGYYATTLLREIIKGDPKKYA